MGTARGGVGGGLVPKKLPETMAVLELLDSLVTTCCQQEEHSCCRVLFMSSDLSTMGNFKGLWLCIMNLNFPQTCLTEFLPPEHHEKLF